MKNLETPGKTGRVGRYASPLQLPQCREGRVCWQGVGVAATPQFSVFTVTPSKIKIQTIQYRKSRISEMKEDKYTKSLAKN